MTEAPCRSFVARVAIVSAIAIGACSNDSGTPVADGQPVRELATNELEAGRQLVAAAVDQLTAEHPELAGAAVSDLSPIYEEGDSAPSGVSVRLDLPRAINTTMDLVRTDVTGSGGRTQVALPSRISNLRGLVLDLSLDTGMVWSLYPAPYPTDVDRPDRATRVDLLAD